ncbi:MAG: thiamine pyrophosphate-binding protein [Lachnospiraceae bacterium]|nr:thiamine pyrophosphate-binding protein [Lachnospiraceae bacterium]
MKLSDYIVEFFAQHEIKDFFGYQGTMIAHFIDSIYKNGKVTNHSCYNEQGAAFAACGYASAREKCALAYATSGPGAVNLLSGVANAFFDSVPVIFITGQANTYEYYDNIPEIRQHTFQELNIVEMAKPVVKYAAMVKDPSRIRYEVEKAWYLANNGRKGPVLLDLPMNIQQAQIEPEELEGFLPECELEDRSECAYKALKAALEKSKRPALLLGNGISTEDAQVFVELAETLKIPVITSLLGKGKLAFDHPLNFGMVGSAYGHRYANMIAALKADLIVAVGASLCKRQTGTKVELFANDAKILHFDIDENELAKKVNDDDENIVVDTKNFAEYMRQQKEDWKQWSKADEKWLAFCEEYRLYCRKFDANHPTRFPNKVIEAFNDFIRPEDIVAGDVGQHMMWLAQSYKNKKAQPILFSGGHGAMGYALPAAIGACIAKPEARAFAFCGDGAIQMNVQELQWAVRENLDLVVVVLNNSSLGLIVQQQDAYFDGLHYGAANPYFTGPDFKAIAEAYGLKGYKAGNLEELQTILQGGIKGPVLIEYTFDGFTKAYPKTELGKAIYNQDPLLPQEELQEFVDRTIN